MDTYTIKIILGNDIRRYTINVKKVTIEIVQTIAKTMYGEIGNGPMLYKDDENEYCTVSTDEELHEAIRVSKNIMKLPALKLYLGMNASTDIPSNASEITDLINNQSNDDEGDLDDNKSEGCNSEDSYCYISSESSTISPAKLQSEQNSPKEEVNIVLPSNDEDVKELSSSIKNNEFDSTKSECSTVESIKSLSEKYIGASDDYAVMENETKVELVSEIQIEQSNPTPLSDIPPCYEVPEVAVNPQEDNVVDVNCSEPSNEDSSPCVENKKEESRAYLENDFLQLLKLHKLFAAFALIPEILQVPEILALISKWIENDTSDSAKPEDFYGDMVLNGELRYAMNAATTTFSFFQPFANLVEDYFQSVAYSVLPPARLIHNLVTCDGCSKSPIEGTRWKCYICPDFDLCDECYETDALKHHPLHSFIKILNEDQSNTVRHTTPHNGDCGKFLNIAPLRSIRKSNEKSSVNEKTTKAQPFFGASKPEPIKKDSIFFPNQGRNVTLNSPLSAPEPLPITVATPAPLPIKIGSPVIAPASVVRAILPAKLHETVSTTVIVSSPKALKSPPCSPNVLKAPVLALPAPEPLPALCAPPTALPAPSFSLSNTIPTAPKLGNIGNHPKHNAKFVWDVNFPDGSTVTSGSPFY